LLTGALFHCSTQGKLHIYGDRLGAGVAETFFSEHIWLSTQSWQLAGNYWDI
jgi:hypothetical protein